MDRRRGCHGLFSTKSWRKTYFVYHRRLLNECKSHALYLLLLIFAPFPHVDAMYVGWRQPLVHRCCSSKLGLVSFRNVLTIGFNIHRNTFLKSTVILRSNLLLLPPISNMTKMESCLFLQHSHSSFTFFVTRNYLYPTTIQPFQQMSPLNTNSLTRSKIGARAQFIFVQELGGCKSRTYFGYINDITVASLSCLVYLLPTLYHSDFGIQTLVSKHSISCSVYPSLQFSFFSTVNQSSA